MPIHSRAIQDSIQHIINKRFEIQEDFISTWLAFNVPNELLTPKIMSKLTLIEKRTEAGTEYSITIKDNRIEKHIEMQKNPSRGLWSKLLNFLGLR